MLRGPSRQVRAAGGSPTGRKCGPPPPPAPYFASGAQLRKKPTSPGMPPGKLTTIAFSL